MNDWAKKLGNLCGMAAPVLWALAIACSASLRPGYSHYSQYISELGERGSSTEALMRYAGFIPTGIMHVAFAIFLIARFRQQRLAVFAAALIALNGLARACAGIFPCDPGCAPLDPSLSQILHGVFASAGYLTFAAAAFSWGVVFRRHEHLQNLSAFSFAACVAGLVFVVLMSYSDELRAGTGLYQRLASGVFSFWLLVFAVRLWRPGAETRVHA